ncbi:MAG: cytochrome c biogenesis protein ResB, partial [Actinomycetota bacterium]
MTLRQSLALVWRTLRSMRTALVLLLLLALAAVAGSLVPQAANSPQRVAQMFVDHPLRAEIYNRIGLFDVYGSWWFTLVYTLLLVSLAACLLPRTRAMFRNLVARPVPARELDAMRHYAERTVPGDPDSAISGARRVLRRRLFRVSRSNGSAPALAADKGLAREGGSLLFHWAFFLILVGVIYGKGTGFTGQAVIVEGETWTLARANFDGNLRTGSLFDGEFPGAQIHVTDFQATYRPSGQPADFVTRAELLDAGGGLTEAVEIRVNHPASIEGVKLFQFGYGWAPKIEVRHDGDLIASSHVVCRQDPPPKGVSPLQFPWNCVVKLPSLDPQVGIEFVLWPDSRAFFELLRTGRPVAMVQKYAPLMTFTSYRGDLGLTVPQSIATLDKTGLLKWKDGVLPAGETVDLGEGITLSFPDLRQYTVLQVSRDRGLGIMLAAAILIL